MRHHRKEGTGINEKAEFTPELCVPRMDECAVHVEDCHSGAILFEKSPLDKSSTPLRNDHLSHPVTRAVIFQQPSRVCAQGGLRASLLPRGRQEATAGLSELSVEGEDVPQPLRTDELEAHAVHQTEMPAILPEQTFSALSVQRLGDPLDG